jgi:hypothetical protein
MDPFWHLRRCLVKDYRPISVVAFVFAYQGSRTSPPSTAVAWKSVAFTCVGMGRAAAVSAMMASSTGRRDATSPPAEA